jgi:hypothetical protein
MLTEVIDEGFVGGVGEEELPHPIRRITNIA